MGKKYTTNFLEDTNGSTGASNQVLISTPTGIDWVDGSGSSIIGGPYVTIGTTQTITGTKTFSGNVGIGAAPVGNPGTKFLAVGTAGTTAGGIQLWAANNQTHYLQFGDANSGGEVYRGGIGYAHSTDSLLLLQNSATALSFTGSQNATFTGDITLGANHIGRDSDNYIGFESDDLIKFRVAGATQVKISDGVFTAQTDSDVDLGSSSVRFKELWVDSINGGSVVPGSYLPLAGGTMNSGAAISFVVPSTGGNFININHTGNENWSFGAQSGLGVDDYIDIGINGGTRVMSWHEDGNVGIGTTSPSAPLEIAGAASASDTGITIKNGSATRLRLFHDDNGGSSYLTSYRGVGAAQRLIIESGNDLNLSGGGGSAHMVIKTSGNVGIGTTSPSNRLEIEASSAITDQIILRLSGGSTGFNADNDANIEQSMIFDACAYKGTTGIVQRDAAKIAIEKDGSWNEADSGTGTKASLFFSTNNGTIDSPALAERMRIRYDGNVGIGTDSPQSKLQVAGGIQMADDTATASAAKVGTMRYRTGTEYVDVTGAELVTNGNFATDANWTKGTGWSIGSGVASLSGIQSAFSSLSQPIGTSANNKYYRVIFTITAISAGGIRPWLGAYNAGTIRTAVGTYTEVIQAASSSTTTNLLIEGDSSTVASIDNVSVVEVTPEDASYADMCMQTGSSTYEWVNIVRNTY